MNAIFKELLLLKMKESMMALQRAIDKADDKDQISLCELCEILTKEYKAMTNSEVAGRS